MNTANPRQVSASAFSLLALAAVLLLISPPAPTKADTMDSGQVCQSSSRGLRCGLLQNHTGSIDNEEYSGYSSLVEAFCTTTSRGARCMSKMKDFAMVDKTDLSEADSCALSVRGTRCTATLS